MTTSTITQRARRDASFASRAQPRPHFTARLIAPSERQVLDQAFRLRHAVFVRELGWVPATSRSRETDRCDAPAMHFGVFARAYGGSAAVLVRSTLAGYARLLLPDAGFMLHDEFAAVLDGVPFVPDARRSFEVSRVVVRAALRGARDADRRTAVDHLARAIASWALIHGRDQWLSVCELRHVRALRLRGFRCARVGRVVEYQPHVPVCAVRVDLAEVAAELRVRRPHDYAWYREGGQHLG
jgi:N-acyl-L-homoserine lactone synthetase